MLKTIISILGILLFFYLVFLGYVYLFQHRMVYVPFSELSGDPAQKGLAYQELFLESSYGNKIHAWYIPAQEERGVVLFCHGNAGNISHRLQTIEMLNSLNMSVFIFDYQGYGKSSGRPGEKETYQDALAAWQYLVNSRRIPPEKIFVFGRSLGGAIAADVAVGRNPAGVILESTFTSVIELATELFTYMPVRLLVRFEYDTISKLDQITSPVLIIHSSDDEIIPYAHGRKLYQSASEPRYFAEIRGGHNTGFMQSQDKYLKELDNFFSKYSL